MKIFLYNFTSTVPEAFAAWIDYCEARGEEPENAGIAWRIALMPLDCPARRRAREEVSRAGITFGDDSLILLPH